MPWSGSLLQFCCNPLFCTHFYGFEQKLKKTDIDFYIWDCCREAFMIANSRANMSS